MSDERKWSKAALKFGRSDEAWAEFGTMERELSAARARIAELEKDSQRLRDINCTFEINHHRIVNELTAAAECGCGDLIPKSEFCHLCGKCQMGCCFCVSKKEHGELEAERDALQSRLDEANAWIGEQSNTPSGAIIARLEKQLVELIAERDALQTELAEECARAESNYSSLERIKRQSSDCHNRAKALESRVSDLEGLLEECAREMGPTGALGERIQAAISAKEKSV